jgi:hypothetical protein
MSDYSLLFDVAKVRQKDLVREVEMTRSNHYHRTPLKSTSWTKKLLSFLAVKK